MTHHCSKHRPAARHRRAVHQKPKGLAVAFAALAGMLGLLYLAPNTAQAAPSDPANKYLPAAAASVRRMDYGSGPWGGTYGSPVRTGNPATADVLLLGDSIGNRCGADLTAAFAAKGLTLATITQSGQNTQGLVDLLLAEGTIPGRVIMEAGTNDVFAPPAISGQLTRAKAFAAANGAELYWGDTFVARTSGGGVYASADIRNSGWVNSYIYSAIPYDHVIGWQPALSAAVGRGRTLPYYLEDGVHPRRNASPGYGDGCAFLAAVYAGKF